MMARKEFLIGNTARGSNAYVNGAILRKVFFAPVRQISGYPGSNEQRLALERGELEGNCGSWAPIPPDRIVNHQIKPPARFWPKRRADMPASVPFVNELATSQEEKDLLDVLNGSGELGRPYIVARQVPAERVETLRAAFEATIKDETFLAEAQKQNLLLDPVSGEEAETIIATIYSAPPELTKKVKEVLEWEERMGDCRSFKTATRRPAMPMQPVADPAGWSPATLRDVSGWSYRITDRDAEELAAGIAAVREKGVAVVDVSREHFPLKAFAEVLSDVRHELMDGRGIVMMRDFPLDRFDREETAIAYIGLGSWLGETMSQNKLGHILGHVKDLGGDYND